MSKYNINLKALVVEDDINISELISYNLKQEGFDVITTADGEEAMFLIHEKAPDIIILDIMLGETSGLEICKSIRSNKEIINKNIPVIIISAKGEEDDMLEGFEKGADDYITKPFSIKVFMARIKAVLSRIRPAISSKIVEFGTIKMDLSNRLVTNKNKKCNLGPIEHKILQSMLENPKRVLSREHLINKVWGYNIDVETRTVDVHINRLRKSLGISKTGTIIKTVREAGYCITDEGL